MTVPGFDNIGADDDDGTIPPDALDYMNEIAAPIMAFVFGQTMTWTEDTREDAIKFGDDEDTYVPQAMAVHPLLFLSDANGRDVNVIWMHPEHFAVFIDSAIDAYERIAGPWPGRGVVPHDWQCPHMEAGEEGHDHG